MNNDARANFAASALDTYTAVKDNGRYADETVEQRIQDLICDLLHLVDRDGTEARTSPELAQSAIAGYREEVEEEATPAPRGPIFTPTPPDVLLAAELTAIPGKDYGPRGWVPPAGYNTCRNAATIRHAFLDDGNGGCRKCGISA